jgi:proton-dependent oligopeptide transporter, POT family
MPLGKLLATIFIPTFIAGAVGWYLPQLLFGQPLFGANSTDAFVFAAFPVVGYYASLYFKASKEDKQPIAALLAVFSVVIIFWAIFHQNGSALTIWAERYTDREMPAAMDGVANTLRFNQTVNDSLQEVTQIDAHGVPMSDADGNAITTMGPDPYLNNLPEEKWPSEGEEINLVSTEIFQSVNPGFVVFLTPVVVAFFALLRRRKREPSTPAKIGWGMVITALSTVVMIGAVLASQNGIMKSSPMWLIASYGVITIGELFLSPMGLSLVSKLSPPRITGLMMGGWFLATALGNKLSGVLSGLWNGIDNKVYFFMINFVGAMVGAFLIFIMIKWLKRVVLEHTGSH